MIEALLEAAAPALTARELAALQVLLRKRESYLQMGRRADARTMTTAIVLMLHALTGAGEPPTSGLVDLEIPP